MAQLQFNANAHEPTTGGIQTLPDGWYTVVITASENKKTQDEKGAFLACTAKVLDGAKANEVIILRFNLWNENADAVRIAQSELSKLCHVLGVFDVQDSSQLHNQPFQVKATVQKNGSGNNFPDYRYANGAEFKKGGAPGAPAPGAPPGYGAAPPPPGAPPGYPGAPPAAPNGWGAAPGAPPAPGGVPPVAPPAYPGAPPAPPAYGAPAGAPPAPPAGYPGAPPAPPAGYPGAPPAAPGYGAPPAPGGYPPAGAAPPPPAYQPGAVPPAAPPGWGAPPGYQPGV